MRLIFGASPFFPVSWNRSTIVAGIPTTSIGYHVTNGTRRSLISRIEA